MQLFCPEQQAPQVKSILEPIQVGVQTKSARVAVMHTTRHWTHTFRNDPDRVLVLIDLANALNCFSRGRFDSNLLVGTSMIPSQRWYSRRTQWSPLCSLSPSTPASWKPSASLSPSSLEISIARPSSSTTESSQARPRPSDCSSSLELLLRDIGLAIARNRTEVAPACSTVQNFTPGDFEGCTWVADGSVKLLGAAIGSRAWCETLLDRRVGKARVLLDAIGQYEDAQGWPSPFCGRAQAGPRSFTHVVPFRRPSRQLLFGGRLAAGQHWEASALAAPLNTHRNRGAGRDCTFDRTLEPDDDVSESSFWCCSQLNSKSRLFCSGYGLGWCSARCAQRSAPIAVRARRVALVLGSRVVRTMRGEPMYVHTILAKMIT